MPIDGRIEILKPADVGADMVDDVNALLAVLHPDVGAERADYDQLMRAAEESYIFLARDRAGHVIGMATLVIQERVAKGVGHVQDVAVLPAYEGRGFASALIDKVIAQAGMHGIAHIDLTSSNERERAHKLYLKKGFKERETHNFRFKF